MNCPREGMLDLLAIVADHKLFADGEPDGSHARRRPVQRPGRATARCACATARRRRRSKRGLPRCKHSARDCATGTARGLLAMMRGRALLASHDDRTETEVAENHGGRHSHSGIPGNPARGPGGTARRPVRHCRRAEPGARRQPHRQRRRAGPAPRRPG
ncbi:MAG: hypothetical protein WDN04_20370 [Rhodospirillales bacterium]